MTEKMKDTEATAVSGSRQERLVMPLRVDDLHKNHSVVLAAHAMVHAHMNNETMIPALEDVLEQYPDVPKEYLVCLWIGVNAKNREGLANDKAQQRRFSVCLLRLVSYRLSENYGARIKTGD